MLEVAARIVSTSFADGGGLSSPPQPEAARRAMTTPPANAVRITPVLPRHPFRAMSPDKERSAYRLPVTEPGGRPPVARRVERPPPGLPGGGLHHTRLGAG